MAFNIKEIMTNTESRFTGGHRMCAGCGVPPVIRMVLRAVDKDDHVVVSNATGCLEVASTIYPYTSWTDSYIHTAFASAPAAISGVEAAYNVLKRKNKIKEDDITKFITFGGDGGTYDIGIQSLSGALERGHDFLYVCYDNGGYMNTGIQRSSATPQFANTMTTPTGAESVGKLQIKKDLTKIIAAHNIPYLAQTALLGTGQDLYERSKKAIYTKGPTFINIFSPCPRGWRYKEEELMQINKLAVDTCYWPMYEIENGRYKITYKPAIKKPIEEFLKPQGRFKHLFKEENKHLIDELQKVIDKNWEELLRLEEITNVPIA